MGYSDTAEYWHDAKNYFLYKSNHEWKEGKVHFLQGEKVLCGVSCSRVSKKLGKVTCKACLAELTKVCEPPCSKCYWAQTCQRCRTKHQAHVVGCEYSNTNLSLLKFLKSKDRCPACLKQVIPQCTCKLSGLRIHNPDMVLRQNRNTGEYFWGCPYYPSCKNTRPLQRSF